MTKRIEEIRVGDKFTKGDWTFSVRCIERYNRDGLVVLVNFLENEDHRMWLTKSQAEVIDTWIEDTSISQAAADELKHEYRLGDSANFIDFIQSLVKK